MPYDKANKIGLNRENFVLTPSSTSVVSETAATDSDAAASPAEEVDLAMGIESDHGKAESTPADTSLVASDCDLQSSEIENETGEANTVSSSAICEELRIIALADEELEKRKAEIVAAARAAEAKAREADEKYRKAGNRLEKEVALRVSAEERLREIEESYRQQLSETEAEGMKRLEAEEALEQSEARIKQIEARLEEEAEARREAEAKLEEALEQFQIRIKDIETCAEEELEARLKLESEIEEARKTKVEAEKLMRAAEETANQAKIISDEAEKKFGAAEARLRQETELRILAEEQIKILAQSLNVDLGPGWSNLEIENSKAAASAVEPAISQEAYQELQAVLEAERKSRLVAEQTRDDIESRLRTADEKHRRSIAHYQTIVEQQQNKIQEMSMQIDDGKMFKWFPETKLVRYSMALGLLLIVLILLIIEAYRLI
jgi:hypothetical protein